MHWSNRTIVASLATKALLVAAALVAAQLPSGPALAKAQRTVVHVFTGNDGDGRDPRGWLVSDKLGNLYGVAGISDDGRGDVFMLSPPVPPDGAWSLRLLHRFIAKDPAGEEPTAGLSIDRHGRLYGTTLYGQGSNNGSVFRLSPPRSGDLSEPWTFETLYQFSRAENHNTHNNVVVDDDGTVYGLISRLSDEHGGIFYKLTPKSKPPWTRTILYQGKRKIDGWMTGRLTRANDGALVYSTWTGGKFDQGAVFRFAPPFAVGAAPELLYSFETTWGAPPTPGPADGAIVADANGVLYGTWFLDGANGRGSVYSLTPPVAPATKWKYELLYSFRSDNGPDGAYPRGGLAIDNTGALFGSTSHGGARDTGVIFKLTPPPSGQTAWTQSVIFDFGGKHPGWHPFSDLLAGEDGAFYGLSRGGPNTDACPHGGCGTVFKIDP